MEYTNYVELDKMMLWIRDYFVENGPNAKAVIGISGGKDSTVCAALLCRALGPENVVTVMMPNGYQHDIDIAYEVVNYLRIPESNRYVIDIKPMCDAFSESLGDIYKESAVYSNLPARVRMTTLYAIAAHVHGRVCNTCNKSEDFVGYSTKFGDAAGDFSLLKNYTVREVKIIGEALDIPSKFLEKTPEDGLCGKTDEENLGFSYDDLDDFILFDESDSWELHKSIMQKYHASRHKEEPMPAMPSACVYICRKR